jgi:hypothetical protein
LRFLPNSRFTLGVCSTFIWSPWIGKYIESFGYWAIFCHLFVDCILYFLNADQHPKHLSTIGLVEWTLFSQAIVFVFATKFLLFGISAVETRWVMLSCGGSGSIPIVVARWVALGSGGSIPIVAARWVLALGSGKSIPIVAARWILALGSGSSFPTILVVSGLTALFLNAL